MTAGRVTAFLGRSENLFLSLALGAMVILPLAEIALRAAFGVGISGATSLVQHLTLVVGMAGAAVAAREDRLLALATGSLLKGGARARARLFSNSFAAAITTLLCYAGVQFVLTEKTAGATLAYDVPLWVVQLVIPLGFGLVAVRLLWHAAATWKGRAAAAALAGGLILFCARPPLDPERLVLWALIALLVATALGTPIFTTLGGAALILFWGDGIPIAVLPVDHYRLVTNPSLPAIPLFTLAGYFLAEGGASRRLIRVFDALFGQFRGGPAIVTALVCAFFTSFTGASGVTILALGGLLMPVLLAARYPEKASLGLLTGAGSLGLTFPPCLPLILYAIVAQVTIGEMFLGGIIPGILLVGLTAWWGVRQGPKLTAAEKRFDGLEARRAIWEAKWELLLPVVAVGALFGGFATPVEAAALTAFYAFFVESCIYRDLKLGRDLTRVMKECGLLVGGVLLILGVALGLTNWMVDAQIPARALEWVTAAIESPYLFLLLLNVTLLMVGCLMDVFSAIVVVVPIIVPIGQAFGIDPVHLGIIFLANLELGYLTPPVGMNLFLSAYRFEKPLMQVYSSIIPVLLVRLAGVLVITYFPFLTTTLPNWVAR